MEYEIHYSHDDFVIDEICQIIQAFLINLRDEENLIIFSFEYIDIYRANKIKLNKIRLNNYIKYMI